MLLSLYFLAPRPELSVKVRYRVVYLWFMCPGKYVGNNRLSFFYAAIIFRG